MDFGPEDVLEFGRHYVPSLLWSLFACVSVLATAVFVMRSCPNRRRLKIVAFGFVPLPLVCWAAYVMATAELTYTLVLLGSESSQAAERTYERRFKRQVKTLDAAVRLAVSQHQEPNVRFYASCLIADMLATNQSVEAKSVVQRVKNAEGVETEFLDGNSLTEGFYVPGQTQVNLPVQEIIERRLLALQAKAQSRTN